MSSIPATDDPFVDIRSRTVADATVVDVVFTRPEKLNAMPSHSLEAFVDVVNALSEESGDVVVLTGAGGEFCVGVDVSELGEESTEGHVAAADRMHRLVDSIRSCPLPVVATVPGRAFGAGFLACMAADFVVADADATFGLQEVTLGIPVAGYATTILPRLVGEHRAREWLFTGSTFGARDAADAGFVTSLATDDPLDEQEAELVTSLAESSSTALALLKERMAAPTNHSGTTALREREASDMARAIENGDAENRIRELLD